MSENHEFRAPRHVHKASASPRCQWAQTLHVAAVACLALSGADALGVNDLLQLLPRSRRKCQKNLQKNAIGPSAASNTCVKVDKDPPCSLRNPAIAERFSLQRELYGHLPVGGKVLATGIMRVPSTASCSRQSQFPSPRRSPASSRPPWPAWSWSRTGCHHSPPGEVQPPAAELKLATRTKLLVVSAQKTGKGKMRSSCFKRRDTLGTIHRGD